MATTDVSPITPAAPAAADVFVMHNSGSGWVTTTPVLMFGSGGSGQIPSYTASGLLTPITLGTGVSTLLSGTPSGTGGLVGKTSPTITTPIVGTANNYGQVTFGEAAFSAGPIIIAQSGSLHLTANWGNTTQSALRLTGNSEGWGLGGINAGSNILFMKNGHLQFSSGINVGFTASGDGAGTLDTILTRVAAGVFGIGGLKISQYSTSTIAHTIQAIASRTAALTHFQTSAGGSLGNVSGGCIADILADVSTTSVDGTFDTLWTVTTVANALIANGDKIIADFQLTTVGHASNTVAVKITFGGIVIFNSGTNLFGGGAAVIDVRVVIQRVSSTTCCAKIVYNPQGNASIQAYQQNAAVGTDVLTGMTLTGTNSLVVSASSADLGAASGDITLKAGGYCEIKGFGG